MLLRDKENNLLKEKLTGFQYKIYSIRLIIPNLSTNLKHPKKTTSYFF